MPGQLFTNYFLEEGILHTNAWQESLSQPAEFNSFPIVRRHDKAAFGTYRTKDMVLACYNVLAAGDISTDVAV